MNKKDISEEENITAGKNCIAAGEIIADDKNDTAALEIMRRKAPSEGLEYVYRRMWLHEWQGMYVVAGVGNCGDSVIKIPAAIRTEFGGGGVSFPRDIRVGRIGKRAFYGNDRVEGIVLERVCEADDEAFACCRSLKWIYLPKCLKKAGNGLFEGCENLKAIFYEGTESQLKKILFKSVGQGGGKSGAARLCEASARLNARIYYNCLL